MGKFMEKINQEHMLAKANQLVEHYLSAQKEWTDLRCACESVAVEWRWATGMKNHLSLLSNERRRGGVTSPRWLKNKPKKLVQQCEHGFDSSGRIVMMREGLGIEVFISYKDNHNTAVQVASAVGGKQVGMVYRQEIIDDLPISCAWYSSHQRGFEVYEYEDKRLTSVLFQSTKKMK